MRLLLNPAHRNTSETSAALSAGDANDPNECMDALVATLALLDYELSQLLRAMKSVCLQLAKFPTNGDHEHRVKENLKGGQLDACTVELCETFWLHSILDLDAFFLELVLLLRL